MSTWFFLTVDNLFYFTLTKSSLMEKKIGTKNQNIQHKYYQNSLHSVIDEDFHLYFLVCLFLERKYNQHNQQHFTKAQALSQSLTFLFSFFFFSFSLLLSCLERWIVNLNYADALCQHLRKICGTILHNRNSTEDSTIW